MRKLMKMTSALAVVLAMTFAFSSYTRTETNISGVPQDIDVENLSMPKYKWVGDWKPSGFIESMVNSSEGGKKGDNEVRRISFEDTRDGKIYRVVGTEGYWTSSNKRYKTLDDAIIAEYAVQKYGKNRQKGRY